MHVVTAEGERPVPGVLRRTLLALLLLHHDTPVSSGRLADTLWGEHPPASPTTSLYNQVMRLRQALGADAGRIRSASPGYQIHLEPGELDLESFAELCAEGGRAAAAERWTDAAAAYSAANVLWRGEPLADIPALHGHAMVQRLNEERLRALQGRAEAELRLGRHEAVVGELRILVGDHPLREEFHSQLMLALYRSERQAEALDAYRALRRIMVEELGVEPGPGIKRLQEQILRSDPAIAAPKSEQEPLSGGVPFVGRGQGQEQGQPQGQVQGSVRQLPADARIFAGRESELDELLALANSQDQDPDTMFGTVVISAINGMGGVGKTALAVRAAHRLGERFPDGQLFIDLHGYSADLDPVAPTDALEYLLRSLGVASPGIPAGLDERIALYRTRLAGTRTLIILDNAVNAAQARPLLPASPGCLVLITSRNRLSSLDDAHMLALDVLPTPDAVALLRDVAGRGRVPEDEDAAAEPVELVELVELCGRIPLALRIAGSRLRHRSTLTVAALISELRGERGRLERLSDGERDLSSVVGGTLTVLPQDVQRLFRLLGLVPGPDFDAYAAAHLAATGLDSARRILETLLDHNLLIQQTPGRYRFHDLLRVHAVSLAEQDPQSKAALDRLFDYYIHTTRAADRLIATRRRPKTGGKLRIPEPKRSFTARHEAIAWLRRERSCLLAAINDRAADTDRRAAVIGALATHLSIHGPFDLASRLHEVVVEHARERGDRLLEANALLELATVEDVMGVPKRGAERAEQALAIYQEIGSRLGEANTLYRIAHLHYVQSHFDQADMFLGQALSTYREIGDRHGVAHVLSFLGVLSHLMSRNLRSRTYYAEAIPLLQEAGDDGGEASCLLILGRLNHALGDFDSAIPTLERCVQLFEKAGSQHGLSNALQELGRMRLLRGEYDESTRLLDGALKIQRAIGFRLGEGNVYWERGRIAFARGDLDAALELHQQSRAIAEGVGSKLSAAMAVHEIARVHHARGNNVIASDLLEQARSIYIKLAYLTGEVEVRNSLAALTADVEGDEAGVAAYGECVELAARAEHPLERAHALEGMGRCELRLGRREAGLEHLGAAVDLYRRMRSREYAGAAAFLAEAGRGGREFRRGLIAWPGAEGAVGLLA